VVGGRAQHDDLVVFAAAGGLCVMRGVAMFEGAAGGYLWSWMNTVSVVSRQSYLK
jgi:hypothetical protein